MGFNIFDLLLPRETKFYTYMAQLVEILLEAGIKFRDLLVNIEKFGEDEIKKKLMEIKECELHGDKVEFTIIDELNKTFITPIDREDIHTISINVDKSLDILNSIARKIDTYNIRKVPPNICALADIIVNIAEQLRDLMKQLEAKKSIYQIVEKMHTLENDADELFYVGMAELFHEKNSTIDIIKYKEVYEHLESVVDSVDYVGKLIRGIKVKQG